MLAGQSRRPSVWRLAFVLAAVAWTLALPLATWAASRHAPSVSAFVLAVYGLGSVVCHQLPTRSFHLWAMQMPVCARCTGLYVGGALGAIASIVRRAGRPRAGAAHRHPTCPADLTHPTRVTRATSVAPRLRSWHQHIAARPQARLALGVALPTIATLVFEWITGHTPAGWVRALAGAPLGAGVAWLIAGDDEVN